MINAALEFLERNSSLIITTHENPDPDGLGAEKVFRQVARAMGKNVRIVNSGPTPDKFAFLDPAGDIELWEQVKDTLPDNAAVAVLDTADEYNIGKLKDLLPNAREVFVVDHHEHNVNNALNGCIDSSASSTCELTVEIAASAGVGLSPENAQAAFAGLAYDTGFFAYKRTTARTFRAALALTEAGVNPYEVYRMFYENASTGAVLLEKKVFQSLAICHQGRTAVQILRKTDLESCGAKYEDADHFVNTPLRSRDIEVSILLKENREGLVRCSLRSKGNVNVSQLAQSMGGGGHVTAAGFRSAAGIAETLDVILDITGKALEKK